MLTNTAYPDFVDLTRTIWTTQQAMVKSDAQKLFIYETIPSGQGNTKLYKEYDVETFASAKPEGANAVRTTPVIGYNVTMTARRFAKEIIVSYEARQDNRYTEVYNSIVSLAHFIPNRLEIDLTHTLTFGTATSYTDMDGETVTTAQGDSLALFSASHTLSGSSLTYSNIITGNPAFSRGGVEIGEGLMVTDIYSNYGEQRRMDFDTIFSSDDPTTLNDIKQFLESTADVDQNNPSVMNVYYRKYRHVMLPWLDTTAAGVKDSTKSKYWGLMATGMVRWQAYLGMWETANLKYPAANGNGEDVHNDNWTFGCRGRRGIRSVSGRGVMLSTGLGA